MISDLRLAQIIAVITELSEEKKADFYKFLIDLKKKSETIVDSEDIAGLRALITEVQRGLGNKVDKVNGKGLSSNDFTNELRTKLLNLVSNVQANWNTTEQTDPSYIANKPSVYTQNEIDIMLQNLSNVFEVKTNKVTSISGQSTDSEYPSAKCVYDIVGNIEMVLDNILGV